MATSNINKMNFLNAFKKLVSLSSVIDITSTLLILKVNFILSLGCNNEYKLKVTLHIPKPKFNGKLKK